MDLSSWDKLTFTDKNGMDTHVSGIEQKKLILLNHRKKKTVLTDIKITTKDDEYIIFRKKENKKPSHFTGKSVITVWKDEDGNI